MNTKIPECWSTDPNAHGVRIEMSSEASLLLPFEQFIFAELKSEGKRQHLRLVFATHEVSICGNALRRIETAVQRMELSVLVALPSSQRSLVAEGQPLVLEIEVKEVKDIEKTVVRQEQVPTLSTRKHETPSLELKRATPQSKGITAPEEALLTKEEREKNQKKWLEELKRKLKR